MIDANIAINSSEVCMFLWIRAHFGHVCRSFPSSPARSMHVLLDPCILRTCMPVFSSSPARSMHVLLDSCILWTCMPVFSLLSLPEVCMFFWICAHFGRGRRGARAPRAPKRVTLGRRPPLYGYPEFMNQVRELFRAEVV